MVKTLVYGLYPRTEKLRRSYNRWERGLMKSQEIAEIVKDEKYEFYDLLGRSGIDEYTDPLFNWYDILRPIIMSMENVKLGPLTRYLETNTFYRMPEFYGIPAINRNLQEFSEIDENPPLPAYHLDKNASIFLPSPYSVFKMSRFMEKIPENEFYAALVREYGKIAKTVGVNKVVLFDVFEYGNHNVSYLDPLLDSAKVTLIARGSPSADNFAGLRHRFEYIVADGTKGDLQKFTRGMGAKVINAHRTKIEGVEPEKRLWDDSVELITHDDYMDFLPREIADIKVEILGKMGDVA
ncbi:MAG: hypothetical protein OWQ34_03095 [Thermoplasma acidophilum]|nr:hypothetical protein [Thermoplasma acidophilum]